MRTAFYNRTAYLSDPLTVPQCFVDLDGFYETRVPDIVTGWKKFYLLHAENICRRIGDIDLYAWLIGDVNRHPNPIWAATLIGSYLVGFFSTCKSLFDAGAICLTELHALPLAWKEQDMAKGRFWSALHRTSPTSFDRFAPFRPLLSSVVVWRDASVHRSTPLVLAHSSGPPEQAPRESVQIRMVTQPDADLARLVGKWKDLQWQEPLHLHGNWRPEFLGFCEQLCVEIREACERLPT